MSQSTIPSGCPFAPTDRGSPELPVELDPADAQFLRDAFELYAELRAKGPVARARFRVPERSEQADQADPAEQPQLDQAPGEDGDTVKNPFFVEEFWLVTRYDEGAQVLQDDDRFSVDPTTGMTEEERARVEADSDDVLFRRSLLTTDAPDHTRLRKLVQPFFTGPALEALRPRVRRIADDLLDAAEAAAAERGEQAPERAMDLVEAFAYPLPVTVISEMLGVPEADRDEVHGWTEELLNRRSLDPAHLQRAEQRRFISYLRDLVAEKRRKPAEDLISFLVRAEDEGQRLSEDELLSLVFLMFIAGHVTTVNLLANAVVALLRWPDQMALVRGDPGLVRNLVEETLRYWGPAENTLPRVAREGMSLGGVDIAAGDRVSVSLAGADRDPARFHDPERFDLTRADARKHYAFGRGVHTCLGAPLARMEGAVALGALLERFPVLRLGVPYDALRWKAMFLRGYSEVPVLF